jgi:LPS export ABC transporter permease LptG
VVFSVFGFQFAVFDNPQEWLAHARLHFCPIVNCELKHVNSACVLKTFDRYLIKNFLVPFLYSLFGLIAVWLVYDLGTRANAFQDAHLSFRAIAQFYLTQIPFILVNWMPLGVLLGLLYVLTRMSRRNEIVSMLSAGMSVPRVLLPLIILGLLLTGICMALNYELGPQGSNSTYLLDELTKGKSKQSLLEADIFVNRKDHRLWFIQSMNRKTEEITNVQVIQQDEQGVIQSKLYAQRVSYDSMRNVWTFYDGKLTESDPSGAVVNETYFDKKEIEGWSETPWRLANASLQGKYMTVPQLQTYLTENADFPEVSLAQYKTNLWNRFSLPWNVLVVVLVASPLCVAFSRRGALAGVAGGILLFVGLFTLSNVFTALGSGARISPIIASWTPAVLFLVFGIVLLYMRSTHRPIPFMG